MSLGLFKRSYIMRKYEPQKFTDGYASSAYTDVKLRLDVQPLSPDELRALQEGDRTVKRIKSFGSRKLISADEFSGTPGDRLFYNKYWYECVSSVSWEHTMLRHFRSEFVLMPQKEQDKPPEDVTAS